MKSTLLVSILSLAIGAGCQKSTDLTKMQAESLASIKMYTDEIETQVHRREDIAKRIEESGKNGGPSLTAPAPLAHAEEKIIELKKLATNAGPALATAAKAQYADEEIIKTHDEIVEELVVGLEVVKSDLAATETWYSTSGARVAVAAPPTENKIQDPYHQPMPNDIPLPPPPAPEGAAPTGQGSAAPATPPPAAH